MELTSIGCEICGHSETDNTSRHQKAVLEYTKCRHCGLVYTNPRPSSSFLVGLADEWAIKYHASTKKIENDFSAFIYSVNYRPKLRMLRRIRRGTGSLLDIGCATGAFLYFAHKEGWRTHGVEVAEASARYGIDNHHLDIRIGTLTEAGFSSESLDAITMWEVVEHIPNPLEYLEFSRSLLKPRGVLALSTPNYGSLSRLIMGDAWDPVSPLGHVFLFDPHTITKIIKKSGFEVIHVSTMDINYREIWNYVARKERTEWSQRKEEMEELKKKLRSRRRLRILRNVANAFLAHVRLGDTLLAYATKI